MTLHKCSDSDCPHFKQATTRGCACHRTDEQVRTALITDVSAALYQYRSDLLRPPSPDSVERRLVWTDELIARLQEIV